MGRSMSESQDRTLPATPRRRESARNKGLAPNATALGWPAMAAVVLAVMPVWYRTTASATVSAIEENIFDGEVSIYPNPSSNFIRIDMIDVNKSEYNVSIINVLGEKVFDISESISGNYMKQIDVRNLANGTYILQIKNEETIFVEKIIIE